MYMEESKFIGTKNMVQFNSTYSAEPYDDVVSGEPVPRKGGIFMREAEKGYTKASYNDCIERDNYPR